MDFATIGGLILALSAISGAYVLEGGRLEAILMVSPILVVVGGTLGATMVTTSMQTVRQVPVYLKLAFWGRTFDLRDTVNEFVGIAEKARREGILGLDAHLPEIKNPFYRKALQFVVDGTDVTVLRGILETEIAYLEDRHQQGITFFLKAGGFAPTMGILGTVLGLIQTLGNTDDASKMAVGIASAFIATLWGVGLANLFFLPVADKLRLRHSEEIAYLELITEGVIALQSGDTPRSIRERLLSFVAPHHRETKV